MVVIYFRDYNGIFWSECFENTLSPSGKRFCDSANCVYSQKGQSGSIWLVPGTFDADD